MNLKINTTHNCNATKQSQDKNNQLNYKFIKIGVESIKEVEGQFLEK